MLVDTLPERQQTATQEQLFVPRMKAWALRPKNLERIIVYGSCILFFIVIGLLSIYLAGFGSEYQ